MVSRILASGLLAMFLVGIVTSFASAAPEEKAKTEQAKKEAKEHPKKAKEAGKKKAPRANLEARFKKSDADKSGSLSMDEFLGKAKDAAAGDEKAKVRLERMTKVFKAKDTDKNGELSLAEFTTPPKRAAGKKKDKRATKKQEAKK